MGINRFDYDEVEVTVRKERYHALFVDYDTDGSHAHWPVMSEGEKWLICCILLRLLEHVLPPPFSVKMLGTQAWCAKMLELNSGDPPIKEPPPF